MKALFNYFLIVIVFFCCISTKAQVSLYQTDDYHGIKKIDGFFIKDSLLYLFSNSDMSGCLIDVLRYSHTINDTGYYTIDKRIYSLLFRTIQGKNIQDSIEFSVQDFCRYENFYLEEVIINEKPYKLVNNKVKVSKRNLFATSEQDTVRIKFYNLGIYFIKFSLGARDSLVKVFFHLNSSSALRRKMYDYRFIKVPNGRGAKKSIIVGNETILFRKIKAAKSYFVDDILY